MVIFTCKDDFESMMTCIYDAWAARLGHSNIRLLTEPIGNLELFCEYRHVEKDREKTDKVIRSIQKKICPEAYEWVYAAAMSFHPYKLDSIYRFLVLGFSVGSNILHMFHIPQVATVFELKRKVYNECHQFREFLRFSRLNNQAFFSVIEPKCNILTLLLPHFEDRMPSEDWMITDKTRMLSVIHPKDSSSFLTTVTKDELSYMEEEKNEKDQYIRLWKVFFQSVSIDARKNLRCQRNHLPLWFRKNMTEFQ
ncbi:MAG: TIGR03915 family putative DNA repair protein [Firmicutes bacterium]|nr:TIGR03915 family putative DNA repair protein [Bacillota bacterium]